MKYDLNFSGFSAKLIVSENILMIHNSRRNL